ncbi:MAG: hypothetical protein WCI92_06990 [Bacteroidota bacterium]
MRKSQLAGLCLIVLSWVCWALIVAIPFLKLGVKTTSIAIAILLVVSNVFWIGVFLAGKDFLLKIGLKQKVKKLFSNR